MWLLRVWRNRTFNRRSSSARAFCWPAQPRLRVFQLAFGYTGVQAWRYESAIADDCGRRPVDRGVQPSATGTGGAKDGLGQVSGHLVSRFGDARWEVLVRGQGEADDDRL